MSDKYNFADEVPTKVLSERLEDLANQITKGNLNQFVMRVPAEVDYCPDLVLSASGIRMESLEKQLEAKDKEIEESIPVSKIQELIDKERWVAHVNDPNSVWVVNCDDLQQLIKGE